MAARCEEQADAQKKGQVCETKRKVWALSVEHNSLLIASFLVLITRPGHWPCDRHKGRFLKLAGNDPFRIFKTMTNKHLYRSPWRYSQSIGDFRKTGYFCGPEWYEIGYSGTKADS